MDVEENVTEEESEPPTPSPPPPPGSCKAHLRSSGRRGFESCGSIARAEISLSVCLNKR